MFRMRSVRGRESRERLLDAAADLVASRGYAGTSIEAISSRAGVVKSALYWHFQNKDALIAAAVERRATQWIEDVEGIIAGVPDPAQRMRRFFELTREAVSAGSPPVRLLYTLLAERGERDPLLRRSVAHVFDRLRSSMMQSLSEYTALPPEHFEPIAMLTISALHGVIFDHLADADPGWLDRWFDGLRRAVIVLMADSLRPNEE